MSSLWGWRYRMFSLEAHTQRCCCESPFQFVWFLLKKWPNLRCSNLVFGGRSFTQCMNATFTRHHQCVVCINKAFYASHRSYIADIMDDVDVLLLPRLRSVSLQRRSWRRILQKVCWLSVNVSDLISFRPLVWMTWRICLGVMGASEKFSRTWKHMKPLRLTPLKQQARLTVV